MRRTEERVEASIPALSSVLMDWQINASLQVLLHGVVRQA